MLSHGESHLYYVLCDVMPSHGECHFNYDSPPSLEWTIQSFRGSKLSCQVVVMSSETVALGTLKNP